MPAAWGHGEEVRRHGTLANPKLERQGAGLGLDRRGRQSEWEDRCLEGQEVASIEDTANMDPEVQV